MRSITFLLCVAVAAAATNPWHSSTHSVWNKCANVMCKLKKVGRSQIVQVYHKHAAVGSGDGHYMKHQCAVQKNVCSCQCLGTAKPTAYPTAYPTEYPTAKPTRYPTANPTRYPTTKQCTASKPCSNYYYSGNTGRNGITSTYYQTVKVPAGSAYSMKFDILLNDLGDASESVKSVTVTGNGRSVSAGGCNPTNYGKKNDYECIFWRCPSLGATLSKDLVAKGTVQVKYTVHGHSWDCDCNKGTNVCRHQGRGSSVGAKHKIQFAAKAIYSRVSNNLVGSSWTGLARNKVIKSSIQAIRDYELSFEVTPRHKQGGWHSILHFTDANSPSNGGIRGRVPAIWFYPSSTRLHFRQARVNSHNDGCDPGEQLTLNKAYQIKMVMKGRSLKIYYNGVLKCTNNNYSGSQWKVSSSQKFKVYAGDPWYSASSAYLRNVNYGAAN